jgi:hypothetical protein
MKRILILALVASAATAARAADDKATTVEAEGQGPIDGTGAGALATAKQKAKDDALRNCVQQAVGVIIHSATETADAQVLNDKIYGHSEGYVRKFSVLEDKQDGKDSWKTKLKCEVSQGKIEEDLMAFGIAYHRAGMPKIMTLIAEQAVNATKAQGWWQGGGNSADLRAMENSFMERMEKSGFTFVDNEVLAGKVRLDAIGADPNTQQAREAGKLSGAQVVVIGRAVATPQGEQLGAGWFAATASVSARAVNTDNGEVIATVELNGISGVQIDQVAAGQKALQLAGQMLAKQLFTKIGQVWAKQQSGSRRIAMVVKGVDDYARLANFKTALTNGVRGVQDVQERSMEDGRAELDVTLAGTPQAFASELSTKKFQGFTLKVKKVTSNTIDVELK